VIRVKICGLKRPEDVETAIECGADALGFVLEPTSPRNVQGDEDMAMYLPRLVEGDPFKTAMIAVFGPNAPVKVAGFDFVQAHSFLPGPASRRLLSIRPTDGFDPRCVDKMVKEAEAEAFVLEGHSSRGYGGVGAKVDLHLAREVRESNRTPMILAGGLTPDSVAEAVRFVQPYGVDVSSGIERAVGVKDSGLLRAFVRAAREA
jgi:phosphoribosylanthranilate isomerase